MPKDLSEAILEDIEVRRYSVDLWKQVEDIEEDSLFEGHGEDITKRFVEGLMEAEDNDNEKGLAKYTARYGRTTREKLKNGIESCGTYVEKRLGRDLYEKIYPVFWLAMLNCPHKSKIDKEKHILDPIKKGTEREQYLFALLIDKRVEDIGNHSIFSGIKRVYLSRLKRTKKAVENFDMRCAEERYCFVRWVKKYLLKENKSGNMKKPVFKNNILTIREMLKIGTEKKMDIPAFIFFLDKLTGWIEFYNFVSLGESIVDGKEMDGSDIEENEETSDQEIIDRIMEKIDNMEETLDSLLDEITRCTEEDKVADLVYEAAEYIQTMKRWEIEEETDEDSSIEYAMFEDFIEVNHIAFLYALEKYMRNDEDLKDVFQIVIGEQFTSSIIAVYEVLENNATYNKGKGNKRFIMENVWYKRLFQELFVNDISEVNKATRIDALNFYDTYITFTKQ